MYPYDFYDGMSGPAGPAGPGDLAWLLFLESGAPGYYMLYSDLMHPPEKGDRTLE